MSKESGLEPSIKADMLRHMAVYVMAICGKGSSATDAQVESMAKVAELVLKRA